MITSENYEHMLLQYQRIKNLVYSNRLTRSEFLAHIEDKTPLGEEFLEYFSSLGGDTEAEINDFVDLMFPTQNSKFNQ